MAAGVDSPADFFAESTMSTLYPNNGPDSRRPGEPCRSTFLD
jgi:hypothetical protein